MIRKQLPGAIIPKSLRKEEELHMLWGEKPYHSLDFELKKRFGEKIYKLTLNGGMTCPNRDGKLDTRGCIFCSAGGSGEFASSPSLSVTDQIEASKCLLSGKRPVQKYIAYFQAYTNTYAPVDYLEKIYTEAICHPEIVALSIATRPDCLSTEILDLLERLNHIKPVWIELGLQTIHETSANFIRRGYSLDCFDTAMKELTQRGLEVIVHAILGLPGESLSQILDTVRYINQSGARGIKLQLLHILKNTDLAAYYEETHFHVFSLEEYVQTVISCIEICHPDLVIHRITGDGPKDLLIAPQWSSSKRHVLNTIHHQFHEQNTWQGKKYPEQYSL